LIVLTGFLTLLTTKDYKAIVKLYALQITNGQKKSSVPSPVIAW
jgi:hypothetical protein